MSTGASESGQPLRPVLAIDTSGAQGAVALYDGRSLSFRSWAAERSHTTTLLAEIHHLLDASSSGIGDIGAIGIAVGPGPFTGLRAGFGVAKGFHLATGVPLIGVSTLEATALPYAICEMPIVATVGAGRGRLVWARFQPNADGLTEGDAARNGTVEELVAEIAVAGPIIVAGELDAEQASHLGQTPGVILPPRALQMRHPAALAELVWQHWRAGRVDDPALLEPIYLSR